MSIYATVDSPDKSYEKQEDAYIPVPEIRTPIVPVSIETTRQPVTETEMQALSETISVSTTALRRQVITAPVQNQENTAIQPETENSELLLETSVTAFTENLQTTTETTSGISTSSEKNVSTTVTTTTVPEQEDKTEDFKLNGLQFYGSAESEKAKMSAYSQLYEYRTEEAGQPWELIMEYENVPYLGKNCNAVLCFTSLGLVGINYFDASISSYSGWREQLTKIYGIPDEMQYDYTAWNANPAGNGTAIYIFALEDGVQISFFADDTGSELA